MSIPKGGIAFFDSGIGGLTVLAECRKRMPKEIFYYYGDNEHAPYGNRSPSQIRTLVGNAFEKIALLNPKAVVIACNTATALCVEDLRKKYPFPIIGCEPAIALAAKGGGEIFLLATKATCESFRVFSLRKKAERDFPHAKVIACPCERLAGEIERKILSGEMKIENLLPQGTPNSVVLGCTHYIYLKKEISAYYHCPVYDGNEGIARRLQSQISLDCRDSRPPVTLPEHPPVFFLGSQKKRNFTVYEQMFVKFR